MHNISRRNQSKQKTLSEFFHIKLDRPQLVQNNTIFIQKQEKEKKLSTIQPIFHKKAIESQYERVYVFAKSGKKRVNTQHML